MNKPLAERVRPRKIEEVIGQEHILGEGKPLRKAIEEGYVTSCIFWGPPGVGKTTLAKLLAHAVDRDFFALSAVDAGVKQVREVIQKAGNNGLLGKQSAILFIDEIHRFNKNQQDALLAAVEQGIVILVGATTENPSFEVNNALLSRMEVYVLEPLSSDALNAILKRALDIDLEMKKLNVQLKETEELIRSSGGDARRLLNVLEKVVHHLPRKKRVVTNAAVEQILESVVIPYDKKGELHYDIISAFIKSIRGGDPNAGVYYLARMIEGGEDVKFIARRLVILASEDIGNANPTALVLANNAAQAVQFVGYPEARIILSQTVIYLASSPKSNASYKAINDAQKLVRETGNLQVPLPLRNAPTALMKNLGYGESYRYSHDFPENFVDQEFLPEEISGTSFYDPGGNPREAQMRETLRRRWKEKYGF
jgi:putative ATPase